MFPVRQCRIIQCFSLKGCRYENVRRLYWERSILAFRAENDDAANTMIDDKEGSIRSDLKVLVGTDEKPLWDGKSAIQVREAISYHGGWDTQCRNPKLSMSANKRDLRP
jgi:hypothetical protein